MPKAQSLHSVPDTLRTGNTSNLEHFPSNPSKPPTNPQKLKPLTLEFQTAGGEEEEEIGMALAAMTVEIAVDSATVAGTVGIVGIVEGSTVMSPAATTEATGEEVAVVVGGAGRMTMAPGVVAEAGATMPPGRGPGSSSPPARSPSLMPAAPLLRTELPMTASPRLPRSARLAHGFCCGLFAAWYSNCTSISFSDASRERAGRPPTSTVKLFEAAAQAHVLLLRLVIKTRSIDLLGLFKVLLRHSHSSSFIARGVFNLV